MTLMKRRRVKLIITKYKIKRKRRKWRNKKRKKAAENHIHWMLFTVKVSENIRNI